ncbi:uncharacterized protein [Chironomus tepperi]|uniref:uncharacterized protein n=1 Tax=Chironomus tepperi TaxID=113505 RepID=UPI00391EF3F5
MKLYIFIILMSIQLFGQLYSFNIDCDFNSNWDYMIVHKIYRCELENNLDITSPDSAAITSVTGYHYNWKSNDDVVGFDSRHKTMNYFPQGLDKYFGNLKSIVIYYGRIKEIHQSDLKPFPNLVNFYLDNNDIEIVEAGLFDYNPNLQGVSFLENKVTKIDASVFDNLHQLQNIWLGKNLCINLDSTDSAAGAKNVIKQAKALCSDEPPEKDSKSCIDRCAFQYSVTDSLTSGFKNIKTSVDDLHASFGEHKASESGKCQINFNDKIENLEERIDAGQSSILSSVDEKINAVESRLVVKIEEILEEKLKKVFDALNATH